MIDFYRLPLTHYGQTYSSGLRVKQDDKTAAQRGRLWRTVEGQKNTKEPPVPVDKTPFFGYP